MDDLHNQQSITHVMQMKRLFFRNGLERDKKTQPVPYRFVIETLGVEVDLVKEDNGPRSSRGEGRQ